MADKITQAKLFSGKSLERWTEWGALLVAGLLSMLVLLTVYSRLLMHPGHYLIVDYHDGSKSYYSLASLLRQPMGDWLIHRGHNYPFGEYIFYTDIAPLVSVPLHWLVQAVPALAPYGLYLYDCFTLGGLVLGAVLLMSMLRRLAVPLWLALVLSVALPWISPQTSRLGVGHFSLAYVPAVLLPLWLLQGLYGAAQVGQPTGRWWLGLGLGLVAASWLHFYYLGIIGGWIFFFGLGWAIREARAGRPWRGLVTRTIGVLAAAVALTYGVVQVLDQRRGLRTPGSGGYDWLEWKLQFGALFRGHDFQKVRFLLERQASVPYESNAYLGAFVLYGLLAVGALLLLERYRRRQQLLGLALLPVMAADINRAFIGLLLLASVPLMLAALGETIELDNGAYVVHNYLNLFLWVHKLTERITQFRALGRFVWPFWWSVALGFAWYAGLAWRQATAQRQRGLQALWLGLGALALTDLRDTGQHYAAVTQYPNLLAQPATNWVSELTGWLTPGRYQALLTLPFYHSGSEPFPGELYYNIDPDGPHGNRTYQLGMATGLPLFAHKATRTPSTDARALLTMFQPGGPSPALLARLDRRPILVFLDSTFFNGGDNFYRDQLKDRPEMLALYNRAPAFIREQHMRRLAHQGSYSLYEWQPKP
jgi:hypothetical protein